MKGEKKEPRAEVTSASDGVDGRVGIEQTDSQSQTQTTVAGYSLASLLDRIISSRGCNNNIHPGSRKTLELCTDVTAQLTQLHSMPVCSDPPILPVSFHQVISTMTLSSTPMILSPLSPHPVCSARQPLSM